MSETRSQPEHAGREDASARRRAMYDALLDDHETRNTSPDAGDTATSLLEDTRTLEQVATPAPQASLPVLSIVIPMYNEAGRVGPTLEDVVRTLAGWVASREAPLAGYASGVTSSVTEGPFSCEIVCVNDGSQDATNDVTSAALARLGVEMLTEGSGASGAISARVVSHEHNTGKGGAVRTGLRVARGQWVLVMDADNATRLDQLSRLVRAIGPGVAMIAGSRSTRDAQVRAILPRRLAGHVFKSALWLLGLRLAKDTQCGFKLLRRDFAHYLSQHAHEDGFAFDIEYFLLCKHAGWQFREVGVAWEHKQGGTISVMSDGVRMVTRARRIRDRLRAAPPPTPRQDSVVEVKWADGVGAAG